MTPSKSNQQTTPSQQNLSTQQITPSQQTPLQNLIPSQITPSQQTPLHNVNSQNSTPSQNVVTQETTSQQNVQQTTSSQQNLSTQQTTPPQQTSLQNPIPSQTSQQSISPLTNQKLEQEEQKKNANKNSFSFSIPTSFYEFSQTFSSIKKDEEQLFVYYSKIDPKILPSLFKSSFTDEHFLSFITIFAKFFVVRNMHEKLFDYLNNLLKINRIDMIFLFLSERQKNQFFSLFSFLDQKIDKNLVLQLKKKFETL